MRTVQFDWVGYTFDPRFDYEYVQEHFLGGFTLIDVGHGRLGYKRMMTDEENTLFLLYDGNDNMGCHLDFSSAGVESFFINARRFYLSSHMDSGDLLEDLTSAYVQYFLLKYMLEYGHFTRLDLAMDNEYDIFFTPAQLNEYWNNRQIVTRCHTHKYVQSEKGDTFYLGSRQSPIMLRVYDKGAQKKAGYPWIRWEFELKDPDYLELFILRYGEVLNLPLMFNHYLDKFMRIVPFCKESMRRQIDALPEWLMIISIIGSIITS